MSLFQIIMEFQLSSFTTLLLTMFFIFMVIKVILKRTKPHNQKPRFPPGPKKLPLIGNMHQLIGGLPHHSLAKLAMKYGPLMHIQIGEVPTIVISCPEVAKEVLKDHDLHFSQRPSSLLLAMIMSYDLSTVLFSPYGKYWRQLRKICMMELLSTSRVESFRSIREEEVFALVQHISSNGGSEINLSEDIFSMTYGIVSRTAFGKKSKDIKQLIRVMTKAIELGNGFSLADMYPSNNLLKLMSLTRVKVEKLQRVCDGMLENIMNEHKENTNRSTNTGNQQVEENLLGVLLKLQQPSDLEIPLTNDHIKAVILDILGAGGDASSTTVEWAMAEMLKNPKLMKQAQDEVRQVFDAKGKVDEAGIHELKLLRAIVKETLRLHAPGSILHRECRQNCVIKGYEIPAKTRVMVNTWAIRRDSKLWEEAQSFCPERWFDNPIDFQGNDFEYFPFGTGRRICPGIAFAMPNIELPLANLLYHFDWKLPNGRNHEEIDMTERFGISVRKKNNLIVIPFHYRASVDSTE